LLVVLLSAVYLYWQVNTIALREYIVYVEELPGSFTGFTILHLSDLHNKEFGKDQEKLLKLIQKQKYDVAAVTGDLVNKRDPKYEPVARLLKGLEDKPLYFVPGNHDWWTGFQSLRHLEQAGAHVLLNSAEKITINGEHLWMVGVDDPYTGRDRLDLALQHVTDSAPKLLLAHAPNIFPAAARQGLDLVLVGHTHGGQVRIPIIGAIVVPGQKLFPQWDYGLFTSGQTTMVINGGLGETELPVRFNNKPEIVLIKLMPAE
jgi:hypothetical protein